MSSGATALCDHDWRDHDFHICPTVTTEHNQHVHYVWRVCAKCGEGASNNVGSSAVNRV